MMTIAKKEHIVSIEEFFDHLNVIDAINRAYSFKDK